MNKQSERGMLIGRLSLSPGMPAGIYSSTAPRGFTSKMVYSYDWHLVLAAGWGGWAGAAGRRSKYLFTWASP